MTTHNEGTPSIHGQIRACEQGKQSLLQYLNRDSTAMLSVCKDGEGYYELILYHVISESWYAEYLETGLSAEAAWQALPFGKARAHDHEKNSTERKDNPPMSKTWLFHWRKAYDDDDSLSFIVTSSHDLEVARQSFRKYIRDEFNVELYDEESEDEPTYYIITILEMPEGLHPRQVRWH